MKQKLWLLSLALLMIVGVVISGCGSSNEIKIGTNLEVTGSLSGLGTSALNGIKIAFKEANESGGVLGKKLVLIEGDNKSDKDESLKVATKLIKDDKVSAIIGTMASTNALAMISVTEENKVPFVAVTATNPKVTFDKGKVNEYAFRVCFIDPFQGTVMANLAKKMNLNTAVILYNSDDSFAKSLTNFFKMQFEKNGGKVFAEETYTKDEKNFQVVLEKIKAMNPQLIFVPGFYEDFGGIVKQARAMGIKVPFLSGDGIGSPKILDVVDANSLNNCFFSDHYAFDEKDPVMVRFAETYKKEYGQDADTNAVLGYDAATMLIEAIKTANSYKPEDIKKALEGIKALRVISGVITMNEKHDPEKGAFIKEYKDGQAVYKELVNP